jgi:hypothetical protein
VLTNVGRLVYSSEEVYSLPRYLLYTRLNIPPPIKLLYSTVVQAGPRATPTLARELARLR